MLDKETQARWDRRYDAVEGLSSGVRVLAENLHLLPAQGLALDLACGLGGNSMLLARNGLETRAWDISAVAVERINAVAAEQGLPLKADVKDLILEPPSAESFDVIVCTHFLERRLTAAILAALRPGGLLFYQTFTQLQRGKSGPDKPEWRLADGELLAMFAPLVPVVYREERWLGDLERGLRDEALLVAWKRT